MLQNVFLHELKGCRVLRKNGSDEKKLGALITTLFYTFAPRCMKEHCIFPESYKVLWKQLLQLLLTANPVHYSCLPTSALLMHPIETRSRSCTVTCQFVHSQETFFLYPSFSYSISLHLQMSRSLINISLIYHTHCEWPKQDTESLKSGLKSFGDLLSKMEDLITLY